MNSVFRTRYDWNVTIQYVCISRHLLDKPFELVIMHCSVEDIASIIVFRNYNGNLVNVCFTWSYTHGIGAISHVTNLRVEIQPLVH